MTSDHKNSKTLFSRKNVLFALLFTLFIALVAMALSNVGTNTLETAECIDGATDCTAESRPANTYLVWVGIFLCSFLGLLLMTFKSRGLSRGPTMYVSLGAAAALNTLMWMAIVYAGAFLLNLF